MTHLRLAGACTVAAFHRHDERSIIDDNFFEKNWRNIMRSPTSVDFETFGREWDAMLIEGELGEVHMSLRLKDG
ncbi:hypothetical protein ACFS07_06080 [Undibacterium arcticum]